MCICDVTSLFATLLTRRVCRHQGTELKEKYIGGFLMPLAIALSVGVSITGCDEQKVVDAVSAIKPDALAFGNLQPGVSTTDDVRCQAGKPEIVW